MSKKVKLALTANEHFEAASFGAIKDGKLYVGKKWYERKLQQLKEQVVLVESALEKIEKARKNNEKK
jgi:hypothetical protein